MGSVKVTVKDDDSLYKEVMANYGSGSQHIEYEVGLFSDENPTEAQKGIWNEFGTSTIPSRPFLTPTLDDNIKYIETQIKKGARELRDLVDVTQNIAESMVDKTKHRITKQDKIRPALSPTTVRLKGHSLKLIETEQMLNAIKYRKNMGR